MMHRPNRIFVARRERGFAMLMVVSVTTMMMIIAMIMLDLAVNLKTMAGAVSYAQRSMLVAEAGSKWAEGALPGLLYPYGAGGSMDLTTILSMPTLAKQDPMCASWDDCSRYHVMTINGPVAFGGGTYRVVVTCYPNACTMPPNIFEIRSEGNVNGLTAVVEADYTF